MGVKTSFSGLLDNLTFGHLDNLTFGQLDF